MERKLVTAPELRLILLDCISSLGPLTVSELLRFVTEAELMNYFDMQMNLLALQDEGAVAKQPHPLGEMLQVTEQGSYTLTAFLKRIPISAREQIAQLAPLWRQRFREEQAAPSEIIRLRDGQYCLHLQLLDGRQLLLGVLMPVPAYVPQLEARWRQAAAQVYRRLIILLSDAAVETRAETWPEGCTGAQEEGRWLLSLNDGGSLTLMLSVPDEATARSYAGGWPACRGEILSELLRLAGNAEQE